MVWWNPLTWFAAPLSCGTQVKIPSALREPYSRSPQDTLKRRMYEKDGDLATQFFCGNTSKALRAWQAKYPEDFVGVKGSTPVNDVMSNPDLVKPKREA